jgi:hypothetical protein
MPKTLVRGKKTVLNMGERMACENIFTLYLNKGKGMSFENELTF